MASPCSICAHDQQREIEAALAAGVSLRQLETQFAGVSRSALSRHSEHLQASAPVPAPVPEASPLPPLVPVWDEDEHTDTRERLVQAIAIKQAQVRDAMNDVDRRADALATILALLHVRAFTPFRTDDDMSRTEEYRQFMQRPQRAEAALEQAVAAWRVALRTLEQARTRLAEHEHAGVRARRQHLYLATPAGQALQAEWNQLQEALAAAKASNYRRQREAIEDDLGRVHDQFVLGAHHAREAA